MPLLIDTYNILHTTGILPPDLAGIDVSGLIDLIRRSRYAAESVRLVCDGTTADGELTGAGPQIQVVFAGSGRSADDAIAEMAANSTAPRLLTVVSSDGEVARNARRRRCSTISAQTFLAHLALDAQRPAAQAPSRPRGPLSDDQIERWIDQFDLDECDLGLTASRPQILDRPPDALRENGEAASNPPARSGPPAPANGPPAAGAPDPDPVASSESPFPTDILEEAADLLGGEDPPADSLFG